jgi:hypothetical protein
MAVPAFFKRGASTARSGNAAPDVPEYADDAVGDPSAPMDSANNLKGTSNNTRFRRFVLAEQAGAALVPT